MSEQHGSDRCRSWRLWALEVEMVRCGTKERRDGRFVSHAGGRWKRLRHKEMMACAARGGDGRWQTAGRDLERGLNR